MDLVVDEELILELKTVDRLLPVHEAQLLTYLRRVKRSASWPTPQLSCADPYPRHTPHEAIDFSVPLCLCGENMLLMIDNYDSFTYNLVQYLGELGQEVVVYRNDEITLDEIAALAPEHIVISPGPCTPNEAGVSVPLIQRFAGQIPILGVCLGHQSIGQAFGGRIVHAPAAHARQDLADPPRGSRRVHAG